MIIKIALIPRECIPEARELSVKLQSAMEVGNMQVVDEAAQKLMSLTDEDHSLPLPEEAWHQLLRSIRGIDIDFMSNYLIDRPQLEMIASAELKTMHTSVIELMRKALELESIVLQLPTEKEGC